MARFRYAEYRLGFQYGTLARELVTRHGYDAFEAKTLLPLDQLSVWTQPLSFTIECAKACFSAAVTHGDMTMACFAACHQVINFLSRGDHLDGVLTSIERGLAFVRAFVLGVCLRAVGLRQRPHLRRAGRIPAVEAAARQRERVFGHAANQKSTRLNPIENTVRLKL